MEPLQSANIVFIGIGRMGTPMINCLLQAKCSVTVHDVVPAAIEQAVKMGANAATDLPNDIKQADFVITMLPDGKCVDQTYRENPAILEHLSPDALAIECSTIDIATSKRLHDRAEQKGLKLLDAPVSGGTKGAESCALTFMVGGEKTLYDRAKPLLELMGKQILYAGDATHGQAAKICNNMILAVTMIAVSESFKLGEKLGLNLNTLYDIYNASSASCWTLDKYCPQPGISDGVPANNDYQPGFMAKMMLKDLNLSQMAAKDCEAPTPMASLAQHCYDKLCAMGYQDHDFSKIIDCLQDVS